MEAVFSILITIDNKLSIFNFNLFSMKAFFIKKKLRLKILI